MFKRRMTQVVLIAVSVLLLGGAALLYWAMDTQDDRNVVRVQLDAGETETIQFERLCLIPGETCEYTVSLSGSHAKQYTLNFDFVETEVGTLKNYARVKIVANGTVVCDELLATAFERTDLALEVDFDAEKNPELSIVYYLPIEIGNEAKNAEALFELLLTASNK